MWVFTRYGFVSAACARKPSGAIDNETIMLRARSRKHLENLKERFPDTALGSAEILDSVGTDYRYRVLLPKARWASILSELAMEQTWSNFKSEAERFTRFRKEPSDYVQALHRVWAIMDELQENQPE
jgi:hypothetical protein